MVELMRLLEHTRFVQTNVLIEFKRITYSRCNEILVDSIIAFWSVAISTQFISALTRNLFNGYNIFFRMIDRRFYRSNCCFSQCKNYVWYIFLNLLEVDSFIQGEASKHQMYVNIAY